MGVLVATLVFLAPIYWISSTAFKPKELAVTVPPTVLFPPEITSFIRVFIKRVQLNKPVDPAEYAKAPWWEQRVMTGANAFLGSAIEVQLSEYPNRFRNSLVIAVISTVLVVSMGTITAYGFSRFKVPGESDLFVLCSSLDVSARCRAILMFSMYRAVGLNDSHLVLSLLYVVFNLSFSVG